MAEPSGVSAEWAVPASIRRMIVRAYLIPYVLWQRMRGSLLQDGLIGLHRNLD